MKHLHPRTDDAGQPVELETPSRPTALASWDDPGQIAMRAAGYTVTLACEYCGTLIDATNPDARIINTTSGAGLVGNFGQSNYATAKAAIAGLTQTLSLELYKLGVTVNCVGPAAATRITGTAISCLRLTPAHFCTSTNCSRNCHSACACATLCASTASTI